jgi:CRP-like cAMP-binding protein
VSQQVSHSLVRALRSVPGFDALDEHGLLEVVGCSANMIWPEGSAVFGPGQPSEALYVVLSGSVRITSGGVEVATIGPGDYFGELSLLEGNTHARAATAAADTELLVVPKDSFQDLLTSQPDLAAEFRKKAEARLAETSNLS